MGDFCGQKEMDNNATHICTHPLAVLHPVAYKARPKPRQKTGTQPKPGYGSTIIFKKEKWNQGMLRVKWLVCSLLAKLIK